MAQTEETHVPLVGYVFAIGAGIMSAVFNIGYALAQPVAEAGERLGHTRFVATNFVWLLMLGAGSVANIVFCGYLLRKNGTASLFATGPPHKPWGLSILMGLLWGGSIFLYGAATPLLGDIGPSIGWPLSLAVALLVANLMGLMLGEWRDAGTAPRRMLAVLVLLAAIVLSRFPPRGFLMTLPTNALDRLRERGGLLPGAEVTHSGRNPPASRSRRGWSSRHSLNGWRYRRSGVTVPVIGISKQLWSVADPITPTFETSAGAGECRGGQIAGLHGRGQSFGPRDTGGSSGARRASARGYRHRGEAREAEEGGADAVTSTCAVIRTTRHTQFLGHPGLVGAVKSRSSRRAHSHA
jgi:hypothetical protein